MIRAVSFVVRDRNWATYEPDNQRSAGRAERRTGFASPMRRGGRGRGAGIPLDRRDPGRPTARCASRATGAAVTDFVTNRTGFVVLHPIADVAGPAVAIEHVDGSMRRSALPRPDRSGAADDEPARAHATTSRRARRSNAGWRATLSKWRTSATGPTRPTRPMCGRSRCPGRTLSLRRTQLDQAVTLTVSGEPRRGRRAAAARSGEHWRTAARRRRSGSASIPTTRTTFWRRRRFARRRRIPRHLPS